jgi:hypothetical protein
MVSRSLQLLMLVWAWGLSIAQSFVQERIIFAPRMPAAALHAEKQKETLKFGKELTFTSKTLSDATAEDVAEFFRRKECLDLILGAGGSRPVKEITATPQLKKLWLEACDQFESASPPADGDLMLSTDTVLPLPGITLTTTGINGVKLLKDEKGLPMYETVLIADRRTAKGPAPIVWIYNQLTGDDKIKEGEFSPPQARVMSRSSITEKNGKFAFKVDVVFRIVVEFPAILVRILPTSKDKMEEQGTNSISKGIAKDVDISIDALPKAFQRWLVVAN